MKTSIKKAILPAAGLGTRFLPATKASPKEMMPIVDKPLIQYAVEESLSCGIKDFIIITGKYKRTIEDHFDTSYRLEEKLKASGKDKMLQELNKLNNINLAYIRQRAPLGLGHAILCAKPFVKDEPFAVILSDDVIDPEYPLLKEMIKVYEKKKCPIIALEEVPMSEVHRYGVIDGRLEGDIYKIKNMVEKPTPDKAPSSLAIIGRYILTPEIFKMLEEQAPGAGGEIQLTDALRKLVKKTPIYGYLIRGRRYDAGDKLGYLKATVDFALRNKELSEGFKNYLIDKVKSLT
ncbi:UTP--glucose-1-phosphate uridylyltransferase [Dissulfurispira thermophila]|uniref:UTP--glucose-1-phosphate uridylyltransferase n=2 Tax=root TaxID=1 RepID=A0A7G1H4B9_9BACT|nr:UTP--glucose-1-phosphate uridylyltransferase GalU [Dissulfurispira thermophila]BCB96756.1 UTP--glucose-1-phosphate uridylyltransferase [Dissulfurispira thermophila]